MQSCRSILLLTALVLPGIVSTGCGQHSSTQPTLSREKNTTYDELSEDEVAASALVFDAPVTFDEEPIFLSRADRQPSAFFGYDEGSIEYYWLTVDDRQLFLGGAGWGGFGGRGGGRGGWSGWYDRYDRRAYSVREGAIRR